MRVVTPDVTATGRAYRGKRQPRRTRVQTMIFALAALMIAAIPDSRAWADNPIGIYVGGSIGQSTLRPSPVEFVGPYSTVPWRDLVAVSQRSTGWKLLAGYRPISWVGAEIAYTDFGHPTISQAPPAGGIGLSYSGRLRAKASTAFGILYAPVPWPPLDIYAKAGVTRIATSVDAAGSFGCVAPLACAAFPVAGYGRQADARFAYGAGLQAKLSPIGIRMEYERTGTSGGYLSLLSLGVTWMF